MQIPLSSGADISEVVEDSTRKIVVGEVDDRYIGEMDEREEKSRKAGTSRLIWPKQEAPRDTCASFSTAHTSGQDCEERRCEPVIALSALEKKAT